MTASLDDRDRAVLNAFQGGFPVEPRPFEAAAAAMTAAGVSMSAGELFARITRLDRRGTLSRFGPLIDANALGGATTLVAARVPEDRFEVVAEQVNAYDAVAHNYEREHDLNMWFVLSVADPDRIPALLADIEAETGIETYDLPKREEFYLQARFPVAGPLADEPLDCTPAGVEPGTAERRNLTQDERRLLVAVQDGLPRSETPYAAVADDLDLSTDAVVTALRDLLATGTIRRLGVVPNHYAIGYTENAMTVWDVPDEHASAVGQAVGDLPFVTHCYRRPRHGDVWPYNLFAMVHGRSTNEAQRRIDRVEATVTQRAALGPGGAETLFSTRILKKEGIRLADRADGSPAADASAGSPSDD